MPWLPQESYVALGEVLAGVRLAAGATQEELAARLGKPQSFVSSYERGQRRIDLLEFLAVVDALSADPRRTFDRVLRRFQARRAASAPGRQRRRRSP